jgi:uncharacterized protein involved in exopolysaccharide biosynthesis
LKQQLPQVRNELDQAEEKLNRYRQQNDSSKPEPGQKRCWSRL